MILWMVGMMQRIINNFEIHKIMKNQIIPNKELISIMDISDCRMIAGGTWLSYLVGYVLSALDNNVQSSDETRYGGTYLESNCGHSSIM